MKNWKTTVGGVLFVLGKTLEMSMPQYKPIGEAFEVVAVAFLGYHAADK